MHMYTVLILRHMYKMYMIVCETNLLDGTVLLKLSTQLRLRCVKVLTKQKKYYQRSKSRYVHVAI